MLNRKTAISIALTGIFATNVALAIPSLASKAPQSSVDACIAQISDKADYENAGRAMHNVETKQRRVSGYKMSIQTIMYAQDGKTVIREYASSCLVNGQDEVQRFKIHQKGMM